MKPVFLLICFFRMGFSFYSMVCAFEMLKVMVVQTPFHYVIDAFQGKASQFALKL